MRGQGYHGRSALVINQAQKTIRISFIYSKILATLGLELARDTRYVEQGWPVVIDSLYLVNLAEQFCGTPRSGRLAVARIFGLRFEKSSEQRGSIAFY
jgi:hypothetical protein